MYNRLSYNDYFENELNFKLKYLFTSVQFKVSIIFLLVQASPDDFGIVDSMIYQFSYNDINRESLEKIYLMDN